MTTWQLLTSTWHWHPSVLLSIGATFLAYGAAAGFRLGKALLFWSTGLLVLLVALLSPLHTLGETYLFSAHMLQHLLLLLVVPPLLLWGLAPALVHRALGWRPLGLIERELRRPLVAWMLGLGMMWLWHLPVLYNGALVHEWLHIVEHLVFILTSVIFWWPIMAPVEEARLNPLIAVIYLFTAMLGSSLLGIILTFAAPGLYPAYLNPPDHHGILSLLRDGWGLTPELDQQVGGLLMWVPGSFAYLAAILGLLGRWYYAPDQEAWGNGVDEYAG